MTQQHYYFRFRSADGRTVAIRAYRDYSEYGARLQAERDTYGLKAFRVTRAIGYARAMVFG